MGTQNPRLYNSDQEVIEIVSSPFSIGRAITCNYVLPHRVVSRVHCIFEKHDDYWYLKDCSTNGTYVNNNLIQNGVSAPLKDLDVIQFSQDNYRYMFKLTPLTSNSDPTDEELCTMADTVLVDYEADAPSSTNERAHYRVSQHPGRDSVIILGSPKRMRIDPEVSVIDLTTDNRNSAESNGVIDLSVPMGRVNVKVEAKNDKPSAEATGGPSTSSTTEPKSDYNINEEEDELYCAICSELFIKATTTNCAHTFCKYCISTWRKKNNHCPICRAKITSETHTLVLDNVIEKLIQRSSEEVKEKRKEVEEIHRKACASDLKSLPEPPEEVETSVLEISSSESESFTETDAENFEDEWYLHTEGAHSTRTNRNHYPYLRLTDYRDHHPYHAGRSYCFYCGGRHWGASHCPYR